MQPIHDFIHDSSKSCFNVVYSLYKEEHKSLPKFQRALLSIPQWSEDKIKKKYKKLGSDTELYHNAIDCLKKLVESIYIDYNIKEPSISPEDFWYRCMYRVAKFYYKNANLMKDKEDFKRSYDVVENIVEKYFYKVTNISSITKYKLEETTVPVQEKSDDLGLGLQLLEPIEKAISEDSESEESVKNILL